MRVARDSSRGTAREEVAGVQRNSSGAPPGVIAYVVLGVIVASQNSYYASFGSLSQVLLAVVATALWPLILLGADLHLSLAHL